LEKPSKKRIKSTITLILRIFVAAAACWLIFKNLHFGELVHSFGNLHGWVILTAVVVKFIAESAMAFRWWMLMRSLDIVIPYPTALRLHFHGLFFSSFLPGSMGGDFIRAWYVSRHTHKRFQSALSVFVDRLTGLVSTGSIAVVTYFLYLRGRAIFQEKNTGFSDFFYRNQREILIAAGVLVLLGVVLSAVPASRAVLVRIGRIIWENGQKAIGNLREVIWVFFRKLWLGPAALLLTIAFQSLTFLSFWLIGRDLGVTDQIRYYFAIFPLVWFIGSIPVSIAGLGILEGGVIVLFMTIAGAEQEPAAAMALCQRAIFLLGALPGIWIHLRADYLPKAKEDIFVDG
jgi:uncharacterized membrane protein YbhN (UPF0104 family)